MHKPLESVIALARFELNQSQTEELHGLLKAEQDWQQWLANVELHGLSGFASQHLSTLDLPVPKTTLLGLRALNIRHQAAAAARLKAIKEIDAAFTAENLSYVALKGAALMPYVFGQPQLRPMRDMDLLMPVAHLPRAEIIMRKLGYDLPKSQPSKYMRDMHQLPNASKKVDGFLISVELHNDGISREVPGHYYYPEGDDNIQPIDWDGFSLPALEDNQFCHQVSKHLEGLHNNAVLKLINVMDVIGLAGLITEKGGYKELVARYPHVENTLKCLHLLTPLPAALQEAIPELTSKQIAGPGQIMVSLRTALLGNKSLKERFKLLFMPSDWWLHLYYNRDPNKSLTWIKWFKHPARVINWLSRRIYSRILGG